MLSTALHEKTLTIFSKFHALSWKQEVYSTWIYLCEGNVHQKLSQIRNGVLLTSSGKRKKFTL